MTTFITYPDKTTHKASEYFRKLHLELDIEKYKLAKYQELFMLASFQVMHDADLAYNGIYYKCSKNAWSKQALLDCLEQEERLSTKHPDCFDGLIYRQQTLKAINEIRQKLTSGALDYLYN